MRARNPTALALLAMLAAAAPRAGADAGDAGDLAARLARIEARLDLVDRKLRLLAVDDPAELLSNDAILADPDLLIEQADRALAREDWALAYRHLALVHVLHPESDENDEAYPWAARLFRRNWYRSRYAEPESIWNTSEPVFMFQWLAEYFDEEGERFPQAAVEKLLVGMPYSFGDRWLEYARGRPRLAGWKLVLEEDDGVIRKVTAARASGETGE